MKTIRILVLLIIPIILLVSWKGKTSFDSIPKTKKINVLMGEITVPVNWESEIDSTAPIWFVHVHNGEYSLTFCEMRTFYEDELPNQEKLKLKRNDSICSETFWPTDSSYTFGYEFHCAKKMGPVIGNYFRMPDGIVLGVNSSAVNSAQEAELITILKTFVTFK
jgi:hypothetical protein